MIVNAASKPGPQHSEPATLKGGDGPQPPAGTKGFRAVMNEVTAAPASSFKYQRAKSDPKAESRRAADRPAIKAGMPVSPADAAAPTEGPGNTAGVNLRPTRAKKAPSPQLEKPGVPPASDSHESGGRDDRIVPISSPPLSGAASEPHDPQPERLTPAAAQDEGVHCVTGSPSPGGSSLKESLNPQIPASVVPATDEGRQSAVFARMSTPVSQPAGTGTKGPSQVYSQIPTSQDGTHTSAPQDEGAEVSGKITASVQGASIRNVPPVSGTGDASVRAGQPIEEDDQSATLRNATLASSVRDLVAKVSEPAAGRVEIAAVPAAAAEGSGFSPDAGKAESPLVDGHPSLSAHVAPIPGTTASQSGIAEQSATTDKGSFLARQNPKARIPESSAIGNSATGIRDTVAPSPAVRTELPVTVAAADPLEPGPVSKSSTDEGAPPEPGVQRIPPEGPHKSAGAEGSKSPIVGEPEIASERAPSAQATQVKCSVPAGADLPAVPKPSAPRDQNLTQPSYAGSLPSSEMRSAVPSRPAQVAAATAPEIIMQLADQIQLQIQRGENKIRIQLKPEYLGQLEIRAENGISGIVARIATESGSVRDHLQNNLPILHQSLQEQGLKVDRIEIILYDAFDPRQPAAHHQPFDHSGKGDSGELPAGASGASRSGMGAGLDSLVPEPASWHALGPNSTFHTVA